MAAWRERTAQRIDIPRQRLLRDEQLLEIASHSPKTVEELALTRGLGRGFAEGWQGREILEAIEKARKLPDSQLPTRDRPPEQLRAPGAVVDMLRTLLRLKADQAGVAARLVASADEIDRLAAGKRDVHVMHGWRNEIFGKDALALIEGRVALALQGDHAQLCCRVPLQGKGQGPAQLSPNRRCSRVSRAATVNGFISSSVATPSVAALPCA